MVRLRSYLITLSRLAAPVLLVIVEAGQRWH